MLLTFEFDLLLNKRGQNKTGTNCITSNTSLSIFKGNNLCKADYSMLGSYISRFVNWANQAMDRGNIDNSSPFSLLHTWKCMLNCMETWAEIESNNFIPVFLWKVFHSINMLNTCVINKNIDLTKMSNALFNKSLIITRLSQICKNKFSFSSIHT